MNFISSVEAAQKKNHSFLCVGLDPDLSKFPKELLKDSSPLLSFNKAIIDATADLVCCYKPQIAYYAAIGAEEQLKQSIDYIHSKYPGVPVILDAKRNDIGSTAEMYAREAFERYSADALTVNPFMGSDTLQPFLKYKEKGVIVLCKTSNPGSADFQNRLIDGSPLYLLIAEKASREWNTNRNVCLVVGATYPGEMAAIRSTAPTIPFLVPGIGAQGGDVVSVIKNGSTPDGYGLIINSSRAIIHASSNADFDSQARLAAMKQRDAINDARRL
jgi:orotidine-5'-phosphate decarboxylase